MLFEEALRLFKSQKAKLNLVETLLMIAACRLDRGTGRSPLESLRYAERAMKREEYPLFAVRLRLLKGRYEESRGRIAEAEALYRGVVRDARRLDLRIDLAESLARLGAVFRRAGGQAAGRSVVSRRRNPFTTGSVSSLLLHSSLRLLASLPGREEALGESFQTICRISEVINSRRDEEQVLAYVLDQAVDYLGAERGLILLREPDGRLFAAQGAFPGRREPGGREPIQSHRLRHGGAIRGALRHGQRPFETSGSAARRAWPPSAFSP